MSGVSSQLRASLTVDSSNGLACAAFARLWECLLEKHRLLYLLLRVAEMRMVLGSKVTALSLYEEVSSLGIHKEDGTILNLCSCKRCWRIHTLPVGLRILGLLFWPRQSSNISRHLLLPSEPRG